MFDRASAAKHYEQAQNYDRLCRCYLMLDDYVKMEELMNKLPDNSDLLPVSICQH
jgi:hypothetical protein